MRPTARTSSTRPASGCCPACVDIHTHYDVEVLGGPALSESLRHGVTTVMLGSCSLSTVHVDGADAGDLFGRVEAIPREHVIGAVDEHKTWTNASEYVDSAGVAAARAERRGVHRPLRHARRDRWASTAPPATTQRPTAAEQARMERCSPRRSMPASSECPRSNCFSTSSTATSAGPARCRRRTRKPRELRRLKSHAAARGPGPAVRTRHQQSARTSVSQVLSRWASFRNRT